MCRRNGGVQAEELSDIARAPGLRRHAGHSRRAGTALSALLRGRIEDLAGLRLHQDKPTEPSCICVGQ